MSAPIRIVPPFALAICVLAGGCGYHVAGRTSSLPPSVKTIAVPALENRTPRYRVEQRMTSALVHEFLTRAKYRIVSDASNADAVLTGRITSLETNAILFDAATGRATTMLVTVRCEILLEDRATKTALYRNDNFLFRNEYEISTDLNSFFEEQDPALDRLARDFASRLVSAILENF
jgi:outer membrane lipopolysaccharide assembly protein LptE/RlpB